MNRLTQALDLLERVQAVTRLWTDLDTEFETQDERDLDNDLTEAAQLLREELEMQHARSYMPTTYVPVTPTFGDDRDFEEVPDTQPPKDFQQ